MKKNQKSENKVLSRSISIEIVKNCIYHLIQGLSIFFLLFLLSIQTSCNEGGSVLKSKNPIVSSINLQVDNTNPVPLVENNVASYSVLIKNLGNYPVSGIVWSYSDNLIGESLSPSSVNVNSSNCSSLAAGGTCSIRITTNLYGSIVFTAKVNGVTILTIPTSVYPHLSTNSQDLRGALTISNFNPKLVVQNFDSERDKRSSEQYFGSMSLFVVNNYNGMIDTMKLFPNLPRGVSYIPVNCPNPLLLNQVCQVILKYSGNISGDIQVELTPKGSIINGSNETPLPEQYSKEALTITKSDIPNLIVQNPSLNLNGNKPQIGIKTVGYIMNNGNTPAIVDSILIDDNDVFNISNNKCVGSINPGEVCSYDITADVSKLAALGGGNYRSSIKVLYNNRISNGILSYDYTPTNNILEPMISIRSSNNLSQNILSSNIIVKNIGNVILNNLSSLLLYGNTRGVSLSDPNNCLNKILAIGASCSYKLNYTPNAPSQNDVVILGGITANYMNNNGVEQRINFSSTTAVHVSSVFEGILSLSKPTILSANSPSELITVTNTGNYNAKLGAITINHSTTNNIKLDGGSCTNQNLAAGDSCTIGVAIIDSNLAGSGVSELKVAYNDSNGNSNANVGTNINWIIGNVPSILVTFNPNNTLNTEVGKSVSIKLILTNTGNTSLNGIQLPILPTGYYLSYMKDSDSSACNLVNQQLSNQNLVQNQSCSILLNYNPQTELTSQSLQLGKFTSTNPSYDTDMYYVTLKASTVGSLKISPTELAPELNWTNSANYTQGVTLTNIGGSTITSIKTVAQNGPNVVLSASGCPSSLGAGNSCTLNILGNYLNNLQKTYLSNSTFVVSYNDGLNIEHSLIKVDATVDMMPIVKPKLSLSGIIPSTLYVGVETTMVLGLTNTTSATNGGNASIEVNMSSLVSNIGPDLSATINTSGISSNPCSTTKGALKLSANSTCYVNVVLTGNKASTSTTASISANYEYNLYNMTNTTPKLTNATGTQIPKLNGSIDIVSLQPSLNFAYENVNKKPITYLTGSVGENPSPSATLLITNTGNVALNSITLPTIPGITFGPSASCNNLAQHSTCSVSITLSTKSIIDFNNLDKYALSYNYASQEGSVYLGYLSFNVVEPNSPNIQISSMSVENCGTGFINQHSCNIDLFPFEAAPIEGSNTGYYLHITFTNVGTAPANSFSLNPNILPSGYSIYVDGQNEGSCFDNQALGVGGSCTLNISTPFQRTYGPLIINENSVITEYSYNSPSGKVITKSITSPYDITVNFVPYVLTATNNIDWKISTSQIYNVSFLISNFYQDSTNFLIFEYSFPDGSFHINGSTNCGKPNNGSLICSIEISSFNYVNIGQYQVNVSFPNFSPKTLPFTFNIVSDPALVPYYPKDCTLGNCSCVQDPKSGDIWDTNTEKVGTWLDWCSNTGDASDPNCPAGDNLLTQYNSTPHCGLIGGWHLPTAPYVSNYQNLSPGVGGNMGNLAAAAELPSDGSGWFQYWMELNGFQAPYQLFNVWTATSQNNSNAYFMVYNTYVFSISFASYNNGYSIMMVHSGQ